MLKVIVIPPLVLLWSTLAGSTVALAQEATAAEAQAPGGLLRIMPLFLIVFLIFYFMVLRPQERREREQQKMLSELKVGTRVLTTGGIIGKVAALEEETISLEIANGVRVRFQKSAIVKEVESAVASQAPAKGKKSAEA